VLETRGNSLTNGDSSPNYKGEESPSFSDYTFTPHFVSCLKYGATKNFMSR